MNRYIDFDIMKEVTNKYDLTPKKIKKLQVLNWPKLKKHTWFNKAMNKPCWCHLEGCNPPDQCYDDEDEFWIGFYEDGKVDCHFSSYEGMCHYIFKNFYDIKDIENRYDMQVQVNALRFLNKLLDEGIVGFKEDVS